MKSVLIIVHINTFFAELMRTARVIVSSGRYRPVFLFYPYPTASKDIALCQEQGIPCLNEQGDLITMSQSNKSCRITLLSPRWRREIDFLRTAAPSREVKSLGARVLSIAYRALVIDLFLTMWKLKERHYFATRLLKKQNPRILLLGGDMVGYDTSVFIRAAHEYGITAIIVPSTMSNGLEQAEVYYYDPAHSLERWLNRIVSLLYPKWVFEHKGRKILRVPGGRVLAMEWMKLAPPCPWTFNSGQADAIAVESDAMLQYYHSAGVTENLFVTGSPADDILAEGLKNSSQRRVGIYNTLGLPTDRPMILSALPPDFLYMTGGRPECDFGNYVELVEFWVKSLSSIEGFNVLISLHPSVRYEDMKYIEQWGVKIIKENIAYVIPLCECYVSSVSSTIRWAIACGKPVINYDVYRYRYTDYATVKGVITVEERNEYLEILRRVTSDATFYKEMVKYQSSSAANWANLDGNAGQRVLRLIDRLAR